MITETAHRAPIDDASPRSLTTRLELSLSEKAGRVAARRASLWPRTFSLVVLDVLTTAALMTVTGGAVSSRVVAVSLSAPLALASIGATDVSWTRNFRLSARLSRLLVASIGAFWLGTGVVSLFMDSRGAAAEAFVASIVLPFLWSVTRAAADAWFKPDPLRLLLVGATASCEAFLAASSQSSDGGHEVVGYVDGHHDGRDRPFSAARIGGLSVLPDVLRKHLADRVVIVGVDALAPEALAHITRACDLHAVEMDVASPLLAGASEKTKLCFQYGVPLLRVRQHPPRQWEYAAKRAFDAVVAGGALLLLSPLLAVISVCLLLSQGRPLLFRQTRVGRHEHQFAILKFRTMAPDTEDRTGAIAESVRSGRQPISDAVVQMKSASQGGVTRMGATLRKTSLDELPQLWNVLRGDMALVGPRPIRRFEHNSLDPWLARQRASVRPGLTGLWQVRGRSAVAWNERINLDHAHVRNWTLRDDLELLVETVPAVLQGR